MDSSQAASSSQQQPAAAASSSQQQPAAASREQSAKSKDHPDRVVLVPRRRLCLTVRVAGVNKCAVAILRVRIARVQDRFEVADVLFITSSRFFCLETAV